MRQFRLFDVKLARSVLLILAMIVMTAGIITPAHAQDSIRLSRLQIDIWPEYDRPDVLVIYRIVLSPQNALPAKMVLRIPLAAKAPVNLAEQDVDGVLYNIDYTTRMDAEWIYVSFTTPSQIIQLEYYDPSLTRTNDTRSYIYKWPGDYPVEEAVIQIQEPINSTRMVIKPYLGAGVAGTDGLKYYLSSIGSLEKDTSFSIEFEYDKPDSVLSSSQAVVFPSEPIAQQTTGRTTLGEVIPWVVGTLGILMIVAGTFWYWHTGRDLQRIRRKRHLSASREDEDDPSNSTAIYCHRCGKRASEGDLYCRVCGTKLRSS